MFITATLTIIVSIILFVNPILGVVITTQVIGAFISLYSIFDIIDNMIIKKKYKEVVKIIDEVK